MGSPLLPSYPFKITYDAGDDRLHDFYLPALERSTRFDRATGFFTSAGLAIAAAGIVRLIQNGGRMRILCGAKLSEEDVEAVRKGQELQGVVEKAMVGSLADPTDHSMKARLEALAWMVAQGLLEIRVVLPTDQQGLPRPADEAWEYYHPKEGVFRDAEGNRLGFSGSGNDSVNGWERNYETFHVYATWPRDDAPPLPMFVTPIERRFARLWEGEEDSWVALDLPKAAREKLLTYCPANAPTRDPLERTATVAPEDVETPEETVAADLEERLVFRFLREAPFLPNAHRIGVETSTVRPWPHQLRVVEEAVERFPERFLFCDEVGLGKTIEAGLVLRQLVVTGRVKRALLLVPKSVMRQWQEELYEKFALNVPCYDGGEVRDVFDRPVSWSGASVWSAVPLLLASSQLVKRRERQGELISADPWDLIIVDEAHHARRKDFKDDRYRPNRLLELLDGTDGRQGLKDRTGCLYLLTATPMQIDPVEVWDLLRVLGLGGRWGAIKDNFLGYFRELRQPFTVRNWDFILNMVGDYLDSGGTMDPAFARSAERSLGFVEWNIIQGLPRAKNRKNAIAQLSRDGRIYLEEMARRMTPLRKFVWRNTRSLLRKYREKGLLKENVPHRIPENVWVPLKDGPGGERELYDRIDEYISDFYQKYEAERRGLGFVMSVYRRRLTSSFHALQRSLERRRDYLRGLAATAGFTDDDLEQEDLEHDVSEEVDQEERQHFLGELAYIEDFLHDLRNLGSDSKLDRLLRDIRSVFERRDTLILFTQYTDTMDYLREQLREVYGKQVACYSGRGGERWDGVAWVPRPKEEIKAVFREGEEVKILLCTESASEGLNLQTCGVLINYDMPWNPMRVEQRIGRIDRIGQRFEEVWIRNYFYEATVEASVYQRLGDRIHWFEAVVGELQPILHRVARTIQDLAMARKPDRASRMDEEIARIRREIDEKAVEALDLDAFVADEPEAPGEETPPVTLQQIETAFVQSGAFGKRFRPHPEWEGVHALDWKGGEHLVTFRPDVFDRYPNSVQLLTYGNPLFTELLASVEDPPGSDEPRGLGLFRRDDGLPVSLFAVPDGDGATAVGSLPALKQNLRRQPGAWTEKTRTAGQELFLEALRKAQEQFAQAERNRRAAERLALQEAARQTLVRTALVELAEAQTPDLFSETLPYGFGTEAVEQLRRHGSPFKGLWKIAGDEPLSADPSDPFFLTVQGRSSATLKARRESLRGHGFDLLTRYAALQPEPDSSGERAEAGRGRPVWYPLPAESGAEDAGAGVGTKARVVPFRIVPSQEARPFENCVPLYDLQAAAGVFGEEQFFQSMPEGGVVQDVDDYTWVELPKGHRPAKDLFVAQVVGESMNRRIPSGAYCLFRLHPKGTRSGKVVLAQHHQIEDNDLGGHYTVKVYESRKRETEDGTLLHTEILLLIRALTTRHMVHSGHAQTGCPQARSQDPRNHPHPCGGAD